MAWPAQALGYKVGEITLRDLRSQAERRMGERFDVREFHRRVLEQGQLPLGILQKRIGDWLEKYNSPAGISSKMPRRPQQ